MLMFVLNKACPIICQIIWTLSALGHLNYESVHQTDGYAQKIQYWGVHICNVHERSGSNFNVSVDFIRMEITNFGEKIY